MNNPIYDEKGNAFYKHYIPRVPCESVGIILCTDIKYKQFPLYQPSYHNIDNLQVAIIKQE